MMKRAAHIGGVCVALVLCFLSAPAAHADIFTSGTGTFDKPYLIRTCADLQQMGQYDGLNRGQAMFKLMNDIDCTMTSSWNGGAGFVPIGTTYAVAENIILNGNYKTIYGLTVSTDDPNDTGAGLFGNMTQCVVYDLTLAGGSIRGGDAAGALAGAMSYSFVGGITTYGMTITGSTTSSGTPFAGAGGLIGLAFGDFLPDIHSISQSSAANTVNMIGNTGTESSGGLIGLLANASVADSYSTSTVSGGSFAGGLVGALSGTFFGQPGPTATIVNSYSAGTVTGSGIAAGGLVGVLTSDPTSISHSFSISPVFGGADNFGDIVGVIGYSTTTSPVDHDSVFYDLSIGGDASDCMGSGDFNPACIAVDTQKSWDPTDSTYFFGNSTNGPFSSFDFNTIWQVVAGALPILRPTFGFPLSGAPDVGNIDVTPDSSSATVIWSTIQPANSQIAYGMSDSYGLLTPLADDDVALLDHTMTISGLSPCTDYHFEIIARSNLEVIATSPDQTFTTTGDCAHDAPAVSALPAITSVSSSGGSVGSAELAKILAPSAAATAYLNSLKQKETVGQPASIPAPIATSTPAFRRDLEVGSIGLDVLSLQKYLNVHGFVIAHSGPGSSGHETDVFGALTKAAIMKLQKANDLPVTGFFGPKTRVVVD